MIHDRGARRRRVSALIPNLLLTLLLWFGGVAALATVAEPQAVVAFGPSGALYAALDAADGRILAKGAGSLTVAGTRPGYVRRLYAGGALFVWPIIARGCGSGV